MKKIIKNPILTLILGIILTSSIGVVASTIFASSVTYDNTVSGLKDSNNQDVTTVQGALDALYTTQNSTVTELDNQITSLQNQLNQPVVIIVTERNSFSEIMFDVLRSNGFKSFKIQISWKSDGTTCSINQTMSSTTWDYITNDYAYNQVYAIPNNNDRIRLYSTNGVCDFKIYLYR